MSLTLSPDELRELTGRRRADAQARVLDFMHIPYLTRPNGTLAVLRIHVEVGATMPLQTQPELQP
jgi:hypothetical protein